MKLARHLSIFFLLLVSAAVAQGPAGGAVEVRQLEVIRDGNDVRIEVTLSGRVAPAVTTATHPDRLVLELPNTLSAVKQRRIPVNRSSVTAVRMGLNSANPPVTRVVVDLEQAEQYALTQTGNKIILTVHATATPSAGRGAAPAASTGTLAGLLRRRQEPPPASLTTPPPATPPPAALPSANSGSASGPGGGALASGASAKKPNRGSLQEGTVFPGMGSPASGTVPASASAESGSAMAAAPAPATQIPETMVVASQKPARQPASSTPQTPTAPTASAAAARVPGKEGPVVTTAAAPTTPATTAPVSETVTVEAPRPATEPARAAVNATAAPSRATVAAVTIPAVANVSPAGQGSTEAPAPQPPALPTPAASGTAGAPVLTSRPPAAAPVTTEPATVTTADGAPVPEADAGAIAVAALPRPANPDIRTTYKVKHVASGVAYLDGGRSSGLAEGMKLVIKNLDPAIVQPALKDIDAAEVLAELEVASVAESSAVTEIHTPKREVKVGDVAYLSADDQQALVQRETLSATRKYPQVIAFSEGDPLDEEIHDAVPRPPLPEINRVRGRIGVDYSGTRSHTGSGFAANNLGLVMRLDATRLYGTYWNVTGYWRGRMNARTSGPQTIQDLVNRTYHLYAQYDSPTSGWVAGFGRLYLPWATSLDTLDGGYVGRKLTYGVTAGIFGGSTPDPTSYSYNPDKRLGGAFINFTGGSFDDFRYTSTSGIGFSTILGQFDRPFVFLENGISYKRYFSIYHSAQADQPPGNPAVPAPGAGLSRSFLTVRVQPYPRVELDFNHSYFRDIPTFDPQLIGTGLLDKYLFQGFSGGARVEVLKQIFVSASLGRSSRSGDAQNSLNQMYGLTFGHLWWTGIRADLRYSKFTSSFGQGNYRALSLSRNLGENLHWEVLAGDQIFTSPVVAGNRSRFLTTNLEAPLGAHFFLQGGWTISRGLSQDYDQWFSTLGYRFDNRKRHAQ
jgi:hypothetical protein